MIRVVAIGQTSFPKENGLPKQTALYQFSVLCSFAVQKLNQSSVYKGYKQD